ncbi:MAG: peptidylprolyl isomerase [Candidatus Binatia bacterium]|nr:peptidylprolyl isomerase [Candidatus Binatia bacterium]
MTETQDSLRARRLLAIGAAVGLLLAVAAIVRPGPRFDADVPPGTAAVIEGAVIEEEAFERAVGLLAADSKNPIGEAERTHVLNRMIEEELLVQRARELGVDEHDRRVRSLLVSSMIDSIVADAQPEEPSMSDVEEFFAENGGYFARTGRLHVRPLRFAKRDGEEDADVRARATAAAERLQAGDDSAQVETELADAWVVPVPNGLLPATKLREYLGPTPTKRALTLDVGGVSEPVKGGRSWYVLRMIDRDPARTPPLDEVEPQVRAEMLRRAGDNALRSYLDQLRATADVRIKPGVTALPEAP